MICRISHNILLKGPYTNSIVRIFDIFDLLFAYREAVRVLDALLEAVFASPNEIDILFVMQRLDRLNEILWRGLQFGAGNGWTDGSDAL